ncbi:MAG: response regulator, partial [Natrinema limicola]
MASARTLDDTRLLVAEPSDSNRVLSRALADETRAVTAVSTVDGALERLETESIDCLLTAQSLADGETGLELCKRVRERDLEFPIVLAPADGDETLASVAIAADVSAYVPRASATDPAAADCQAAIEQALADGHERRDVRRDCHAGQRFVTVGRREH